MMNGFIEEINNIYRLRVPFDAIYTSVFLIRTEGGVFLVDTATTDKDVDQYIIPAILEMGYAPTELSAIVLTHRHGDHAGGAKRIAELAPEIRIVTDVCLLTEGLLTYPLAGHTRDSIGVFDERTRTLISGDGLQGAGVDKYRCSLKDPEEYLETLRRIEKDERIENILFSHAYEPWNNDSLFGRERVLDCLNECFQYGRR